MADSEGLAAVDDGSAPGGIVAANVHRSFGDVVAVDNIGLSAPAGQVTALVGPNGAGKTTLLLMLATLLAPDAGEIRVAGHDPVRAPHQVRSRIGWMPDSFGTYDTLTAREVLEFVAAAYRLPRDRHSVRARELLALVHLEEFADRPIHVLSRGQQQRLGLARTLVHDPTVLLLDEPAAGLDPRSRIELRGILRRLAVEGRAVLVSSHVLAELEQTADRVVFVDHGRTVSEHHVADLRSTQRRPWRLRTLDQESLLSSLTGLGTVITGEAGPAGVEVMLASDEEAAELVAALVRDGVPVVACAPAAGSLEAAYLELTENRR